MIRRLFKTGNSIVLSLPREVLEDLGVGNGQDVNLELDRDGQRLIISPAEKPKVIAGIDNDFARQVNEFIEQYQPALDELAK